MPAPIALAPIAWKVAQVGAVAAITVYAARRRRPDGPREVWRERVFDDVEEGLETDYGRVPDEARLGGAGRFKRTLRMGRDGPGLEVDLSGLARLRLRRVPGNR